MDVLFKIFNAKFIFLSFLVSVILWLVYKFIEEKLSPLQKIPSPPGKWPLVGHLFTFLRGDILEVLRSWNEKYSPMFVYHPGLRTGIESKSKETKFYLVWFVDEFKYSVVEGKYIEELNPKTKDKVHVKSPHGSWKGVVYTSGSEQFCEDRQHKLEELCQNFNDEDKSEHEAQSEERRTKRKGKTPISGENPKRRKASPAGPSESDVNVDMSDSEEKEEDFKDCEKELELIKQEKERVNRLLCSSKERVHAYGSTEDGKMERLFQGLYKRMDMIMEILERLAEQKEAKVITNLNSCSTPTQPKVERKPGKSMQGSSQSSPSHEDISVVSEDISFADDPEFIAGGINLIVDVPAKAKKPTLYATALMTHLFTNEEMRQGSVEPKETHPSKGKKALDQTKINLIKSGYTVCLTDPELIRYVAVNGHKFHRPDFVKRQIPSVGNGLFSSNGKAHARQKRMVGPAFTTKNLKGFSGIFQENVENLVKLWSTKLEDPVAVHDDLSHLTLDVIGQSAFGCNFNTVLAGESKVSQAVNVVIGGMSFRYMVCKALIPFFELLPIAETRRIKEARDIADNTVLDVIHERRKERKAGIVKEKKDLLDLLMDMYDEETGTKMEDEELRAQVFTFMLAGHETTSVALAWTLYELAKYPLVQEKVRTEINTVLREGSELTWDTVEELKYLESVIKESLRLHPPAHLTGRTPISDEIVGGYLIPKGVDILLPIDSLQHGSRHWQNPNEFYPERFNEKGGQSSVKPYSYFPFGVGSRMCIGNKFALMEMKVMVATLLKTFSFSEVPGCTVKAVPMLTTRPKGLKLLIRLADLDE